ncbi:MAG TPA: cell division protein ZipA C-terminal FtsZ-binding domain-containing protein [Steroidobacteraceae bacterium]|nr:cell division protein ZipA C-terminal FtsZ-binding domain-containing protein [Steroidobacteraceae bacterium]
MAADLRWILLALSLTLLAGIWWWGRRRSSQAPGDALLREITPASEPQRPETAPREATLDGDWGVPPFEPLSIRTQDYEHVPVLDGPMMVSVDPTLELTPAAAPAAFSAAPAPIGAAPARPSAVSVPGAAHTGVVPGRVPTLQPESTDRNTAAPPQSPNASEQQKIVTVRVCAPGEARWPGATLLSALELHGLAYGRYQVFHRRHVDGRSLFCVASLIEPGTFDVARMSSEEFRGVTLFAVLPGPVEPLVTVDELLGAARGLAHELSGMVQDNKGMPLSPQRAAALRDDVARFQASLPRG